MKFFIMIGGLLSLAALAQAQGDFVKTLRPEVYSAAGLQKLSPAELAQLEAAVQNYKSGVVAEVKQPEPAAVMVTQQEAEQKVAAAETKAKQAEEKVVAAETKTREAELKIAAAETKAREAEAKAREVELKSQEAAAKSPPAETKAAAAPAKKEPSWYTALLTLNKANKKPEKAQPLESRLVGDFRGWSGRTTFTLENGTRWSQQNPGENYPYAPPIHAPKVKIKPASINGFWLEIEGVDNRVRVVPLSLPDQK